MFKRLVAFWLILVLLDIITTYYCLHYLGLQEANPIANWFLVKCGDAAYFLFTLFSLAGAQLFFLFERLLVTKLILYGYILRLIPVVASNSWHILRSEMI